jgi:hypothetical protein
MRSASRLRPLGAALAVGLLAAACQDSALAPARESVGIPRPALYVAGWDNSTTFTYEPSDSGRAYELGDGHQIYFPDGAVCDPAVSTYGPGEWDQPCAPLATPIEITATRFHDAEGNPYVDFHPALRFVPGKPVTLFLRDPDSALDARAEIVWCSDGGLCVSEPSPTRRDPASGILYREIQHFSGYLISAGRTALSSTTSAITDL